MTVIEIKEDVHGNIGYAKDYKSAIHFLIEQGWLYDNLEYYDEEKSQDIELYFYLGENWQEVLLNWNIEKFNDYFEYLFHLEKEEVYEYIEEV